MFLSTLSKESMARVQQFFFLFMIMFIVDATGLRIKSQIKITTTEQKSCLPSLS
uniref:Uncharacterized protein n=1 Tax=Rhizophora mucronata TaxID=61149 RepID=A0A2P2QPB7_RHIMU